MIIILAAGKGTRMNSDLPKVLHKVGTKTMIEHVVDTSSKIDKNIVIVVSKQNIDLIKSVIKSVSYFIQEEQLGTGHAVRSVLNDPNFKPKENETILVLLGDVPLISEETLNKIYFREEVGVILGFYNHYSNKLGRLFLNDNYVKRIIEFSELTEKQKDIKICNSGLLKINSNYIHLLDFIQNNNNKKEYYLTDIVSIMNEHNIKVGYEEGSFEECFGVNTKKDLEKINSIFYKKFFGY